MKPGRLSANALPIADKPNNVAMINNTGFRPYFSAGQPPNSAPSKVPINADEIVKPCQKDERLKRDWIDFSTPEITAVSNPKRNPPRATITDQPNTVRSFFLIMIVLYYPFTFAGR